MNKLLNRYGWFEDNSDKRAHVPRTQRPNLRGMFDMHGNVNEWCHDWYEPFTALDVEDLAGPPTGSNRVIRGGGWRFSARFCRSAYRFGLTPAFRFGHLGFRLALVPSSKSSKKLASGAESESR